MRQNNMSVKLVKGYILCKFTILFYKSKKSTSGAGKIASFTLKAILVLEIFKFEIYFRIKIP